MVRLEPLRLEHAAALYRSTNGEAVTLSDGRSVGSYDADAAVWRFLFRGPFATKHELG
jgi:hypothetical protein